MHTNLIITFIKIHGHVSAAKKDARVLQCVIYAISSGSRFQSMYHNSKTRHLPNLHILMPSLRIPFCIISINMTPSFMSFASCLWEYRRKRKSS